MVRHRLVTVSYALVALPPLAITVVLAGIAGAELAGAHPLTMGAPRSVSEAIAMRDEGAAARFVEDGASVTAIGLIRRGILSEQAVLATPAETAVLVDAPPALEFLASRGVVLSPNLACLAMDIGARAVRSRLGDLSSCRAGDAIREVLARP